MLEVKNSNSRRQCPNCGARRSLALSRSASGRLLAFCFAGCNFRDIVKKLDIEADWTPPPAPLPAAHEEWRTKFYARQLRKAANLSPDSLGVKYFAARAIPCEIIGGELRFSQEFPFYCEEKLIEHMPAILAPVRDSSGSLVSLHVTYLNRDGSKFARKFKPAARKGATKGGAVRLHDHGDILVVGEGIETTLSLFCVLRRRYKCIFRVWAALSANGLENVHVPSEVRRVIIAEDNDDAGRKAARCLATRMRAEVRKVVVASPCTRGDEPAGFDWNSFLMESA